MRILLFLATLFLVTGAHAQFRLPNLDVNRMVDTVKNVG